MRTVIDGGFVAPWTCFLGGSAPAGNTTTTTNTQPWSAEQPYLESIYSQAANLDANNVPQYYPGDTYAPLTGQQTGLASNLIGATENGGSTGLQAANGEVASTLSPQYTAQTQGTFNAGTGVLDNELTPGYLNPSNSPAYQTAISSAIAAAAPAAASSFVNGNRSDSGLATAAETSAATNAAAGLAQNQYNTNVGVQQNAANIASNNLLTQQGNQVKQTLTAPTVDQAITSDLTTALSTAGMGQTNNQNQINADVAAYNYNQMLPWNQLGLLEGAVTGTGNPGGTSTTTQPYFQNTSANILGLGTGILGLNGLTGSSGGGFGSTLLGGIGNWIMASDARIKTDIERIGESDSGFPLYMFRYRHEPVMARHIGVMAQDVEKRRPEAVVETPSGVKAVNYSLALAPRGIMSEYLGAAP